MIAKNICNNIISGEYAMFIFFKRIFIIICLSGTVTSMAVEPIECDVQIKQMIGGLKWLTPNEFYLFTLRSTKQNLHFAVILNKENHDFDIMIFCNGKVSFDNLICEISLPNKNNKNIAKICQSIPSNYDGSIENTYTRCSTINIWSDGAIAGNLYVKGIQNSFFESIKEQNNQWVCFTRNKEKKYKKTLPVKQTTNNIDIRNDLQIPDFIDIREVLRKAKMVKNITAFHKSADGHFVICINDTILCLVENDDGIWFLGITGQQVFMIINGISNRVTTQFSLDEYMFSTTTKLTPFYFSSRCFNGEKKMLVEHSLLPWGKKNIFSTLIYRNNN